MNAYDQISQVSGIPVDKVHYVIGVAILIGLCGFIVVRFGKIILTGVATIAVVFWLSHTLGLGQPLRTPIAAVEQSAQVASNVVTVPPAVASEVEAQQDEMDKKDPTVIQPPPIPASEANGDDDTDTDSKEIASDPSNTASADVVPAPVPQIVLKPIVNAPVPLPQHDAKTLDQQTVSNVIAKPSAPSLKTAPVGDDGGKEVFMKDCTFNAYTNEECAGFWIEKQKDALANK